MMEMYGGGGNSSDGLLGEEKSVQLGDEIVGVAEDNIFMMVHRRHRALSADKRFLRGF